MDAVVMRESTLLNLPTNLLSRLREAAKAADITLDDFVEEILTDVVYHTPNAETAEAIEEAQAGQYAGSLDVTNYETFLQSVDAIQ